MHKAYVTQLEINLLGVQTINHSPYSPDLAPMDFTVFPEIKAQLEGCRFTTFKELTTAIHSTCIIPQFDQDWYKNVFNLGEATQEVCGVWRGVYFEKL